MCGLRVTVEAGTVGAVRGNPDDVWSRGHLCAKGASLQQIHHDPGSRRRTSWVGSRRSGSAAAPWWSSTRGGRRRRGAPEVLGQFPVSCLAEEIDTPGDGQIRALITVAGNPAVSAPGHAGSTRRWAGWTR